VCDVPVQETHTTILKWGLVQWNRDEWFELLDVRQSCWETKRQAGFHAYDRFAQRKCTSRVSR